MTSENGGVAPAITFPGGLVIRGAGARDQLASARPDWGVYADDCWLGWPGVVLDWPDFEVPRDDEDAIARIMEAIGRARSGQDVLVGCRGGIGRTGTILAAVAIATGVPAERARDWVRARYHADAVETDAQQSWLLSVVAQDASVQASADRTRRTRVHAITTRLQKEMREALEASDPLPRLAWAIDNVLAVTQRPLRAHPVYGGSGIDYPHEARPAIDAWIADVVQQGISSLIVLTSAKELRHYDGPTARDGGLLNLYANAGLEVAHFPADDPRHDLTARAAFDAAVDDLSGDIATTFRRLQHPAALQCSAAIDRSPPVAARLAFLHDVDCL